VETAAQHVRRASELLGAARNWYGLVAPLHCARGRIATARARWDEAIECFQAAIAVDRQYELPWDQAKALQSLGLTHLARDRAGDRERARWAFDQAAEIFRRVGAAKDLEKVSTGREVLPT
jgi:tetratricopeptide (TPR) repeat protein